MNTHYDDRPPSSQRAAGYWVDRAWQDVLDAKRWANKGQPQDRRFGFLKPKHPHRRYGPKDICSVCQERSPRMNGKCSRCYHREYMRERSQQQHLHAKRDRRETSAAAA